MSLDLKKVKEVSVAKYFLDWLNRHFNFDYQARSNCDERNVPAVDVFAVSISGKIGNFDIQVVTREGKLEQTLAKCRKHPNEVLFSLDLDSISWTVESVLKKEEMYSEETKRGLVLLVGGEIGPLLNEKYAEEKFKAISENSKFRGIYYVRLPSDKNMSSYACDGQVIEIKRSFVLKLT